MISTLKEESEKHELEIKRRREKGQREERYEGIEVYNLPPARGRDYYDDQRGLSGPRNPLARDRDSYGGLRGLSGPRDPLARNRGSCGGVRGPSGPRDPLVRPYYVDRRGLSGTRKSRYLEEPYAGGSPQTFI